MTLKKLRKQAIIESINTINSNRENLFEEKVANKSIQKCINTVSAFFEVSDRMSAVLSVIVYDQILGDGQGLKKILRDLSIGPMEAIDVYQELKVLKVKGWIHEVKSRLMRLKDQYEVSNSVLQAVMNSDKSLLRSKTFETQEDALVEMSNIFNQYCTEHNREELVEILMYHMRMFMQYPLFKKVLTDKNLSEQEQLLIIWMASEFVTHRNEVVDLSWVVDRIFHHPYWINKIQKRLNLDGYLIEHKYLTYPNPGVVDIDKLMLGDAINDLLDESYRKTKSAPVFKLCELIHHATIPSHKLFFNETNTRNMDELKSITDECRYEKIVSTFKKHGMPTGIAVLLSGPPGTGKTETVKQLARKQDRLLLMVDISKFKSMWLGETEKNIKKIFQEYKAATKYYTPKPILLLNEADALLSTRNTVSSSVDQTMNNIQNILLQELEDFDGILMATTNMIDNLDPAFDRRFILKFTFELPNAATLLKIIEHQFPELSTEHRKLFANNYTLTGAQIQNIRRRIIAKQVINSDFILDKIQLERMAAEELKIKTPKVIGYLKNAG
jgi:hypothetical protein